MNKMATIATNLTIDGLSEALERWDSATPAEDLGASLKFIKSHQACLDQALEDFEQLLQLSRLLKQATD
jgi:hypothetical protein